MYIYNFNKSLRFQLWSMTTGNQKMKVLNLFCLLTVFDRSESDFLTSGSVSRYLTACGLYDLLTAYVDGRIFFI